MDRYSLLHIHINSKVYLTNIECDIQNHGRMQEYCSISYSTLEEQRHCAQADQAEKSQSYNKTIRQISTFYFLQKFNISTLSFSKRIDTNILYLMSSPFLIFLNAIPCDKSFTENRRYALFRFNVIVT